MVMDVRTLSSVTGFFVLCTAGSSRQLSALQEHIEAMLTTRGAAVWHSEGTAGVGVTFSANHVPQWVLLDCGDIVVHLFDEPARTLYRLEELWADAPRVPLSPLPSQS